jgi:kynurenine formamidase
MNLEPLSAAKAYTVALVITPLKIQGGTGSPRRALAVAP